MTIAADDREALRAEIARFAHRAVEPRVERPEQPASPVEMAVILAEAETLGLAGSTDEPTGLGVWESLIDGARLGPSLDALVQIARANPATAYAVHQRALARAACRMAGLPAAVEALAIAPTGRHGLGRRPIARWLAGAELDDGDRAVLDDIYSAGARRIATVEPGFAGIVTPVRNASSVQWLAAARDELAVDVYPDAHGLDELTTVEVALSQHVATSSLDEPRARGVFAAIAGAHQLATVAIARGAVERGLQLARRYAAERYQGGAMIDRHPAVLELLGRCRAELVVVDALLVRAAGETLDPAGFVAGLAVRSRAMPALAGAANAALQVFGGIGYMRDVGAEKIVRDVNHLRAIAGPLGELELIVAEWERLDA